MVICLGATSYSHSRRVHLIWLCLLLTAALFETWTAEPEVAASTQPPSIRVAAGPSEVLVFSHQALVTRRQTIAIPQGRSVLMWPALPATMVAESLRASLAGLDGVHIRSVRYDLLPDVVTDQTAQQSLSSQRDEKVLALRQIKDQQALAALYADLVAQITFPDQDQHRTSDQLSLQPAAWTATLDFIEQETSQTLDHLRLLNQQATTVQAEVSALDAQLATYDRDQVPAFATALIEIEANQAGEIQAELSYMVGQVAWYPSYTFTVDDATSTIDLVRAAWVGQHSGEDWSQVRLTFATGTPHRLQAMPRLRSWRIAAPGQADLNHLMRSSWQPDEQAIARPPTLAAAGAIMTANPTANRKQLQLHQVFGQTGEGSLVRGRAEAVAMSAMGGSSAFMAMGASGDAAGAFGTRSGGGRKVALGRYGGTRASESAVQENFLWAAQWLSPDHIKQQSLADVALVVLTYAGSGYDHRHPSRWRKVIEQGLTHLQQAAARDSCQHENLWTHSLVTAAIVEVYGMTNDPALRSLGQTMIAGLEQRVMALPWQQQSSFTRHTWPDGRHNLAFVTMAMKSAKMAGLHTSEATWLGLRSMLASYARDAGSDLDVAAALFCQVYLGFGRGNTTTETLAQRLATMLPDMQPGRFDHRMVFLAQLGMFQVGGQHWKAWNKQVRDALIASQLPNGSWPPVGRDGMNGGMGGGGSQIYATMLHSMALQTYYRYQPIHIGAGVAQDTGSNEIHYIAPVISAAGRDDRFTALQPETLSSTGTFKFISLERHQLSAQLTYHTVPLAHSGAWLMAEVSNSTGTTFLPGEARLFVGSDYLGSVFLEHVLPQDNFTIPLGMDPGIQIQRQLASASTTTGFRGMTKRNDTTVDITVTNQRKRTIQVLIADRVPRPAEAQVRIADIVFVGSEPSYDPDSHSGAVQFMVTIEPGKTSQVGLRYAIEHPADTVLAAEDQ